MSGVTSKLSMGSLLQLMAVSIPAVYLIGYYYDYGYLNAFGLNNEYFPRDIQEYLVKAYLFFLDIYPDVINSFNILELLSMVFGIFYVSGIIAIGYIEKEEIIKDKIKSKVEKSNFFRWLLLPILFGIYGTSIAFIGNS